MIHLRTIDFRYLKFTKDFPFNLSFLRYWKPLVFTNPVTFFVGENGSGKSTVIEAIAGAIGSITIGSESLNTDPTLNETRRLAKKLRLTWNKQTHKGFFLRAEDFFGYVKQLKRSPTALEHDLMKVDEEYADRSQFAKNQAKMAFTRELSDIQNRYGEGLDVHSQGESFLELLQTRFVPGWLYLLDEPEAALSPLSQLGLLLLLKEMVRHESQFIIATHSPIIMAYPEANILSFDQVPLRKVSWDSLEHVRLTRDFLNNPTSFLRHIYE